MLIGKSKPFLILARSVWLSFFWVLQIPYLKMNCSRKPLAAKNLRRQRDIGHSSPCIRIAHPWQMGMLMQKARKDPTHFVDSTVLLLQ